MVHIKRIETFQTPSRNGIVIILLFLGQFLCASLENDVKTFHEYEVADLGEIIPGWTYYSKNEEKSPHSKFSVTQQHFLRFSKKSVCEENRLLFIDTLVILEESIYFKGHFRLKPKLGKCFGDNELQSYKVTPGTYELYLPLLQKRTTTLSISRQMFPKNFYLSSIHCENVPQASLISINKDRKLRIDGKLMKGLFRNELHCIVYGKSIAGEKEKRMLIVQFPPIVQVLSRHRRSSAISFEKDMFYVKVNESASVGSTILKLKASGGSGSYLYSKNADSKTDRLFSLNAKSGELQILNQLNREDGATRFTIDIAAKDKANNDLIARTSVQITILDMNDNRPIFEKLKYEADVIEEQSGRYITSVKAVDADEGKNQHIVYSIVKSSVDEFCPFKIVPDTGVISSTEPLDREKMQYYVITVKAQDGGEPPLSSTVLVNISLIDINDNDPEFEKAKYQVTIFENTTVGSVIVTVVAHDEDSGSNGEIRYQPLDERAFTINSRTGEISLAEELDYDRYQLSFDFTVVAFDDGSPPGHSNTQVKVLVEDVNDNAPRFTREVFKPSRDISETTRVGEIIFKLSARDRDSGVFGQITYKLGDSIPSNFPFSLDSSSGEIKLIKKLDYEIQREYKFQVIVSDGGSPPKTDTAQVDFKVGNVNDNPPQFVESTYRLDISEDTRKGAPILTVTAKDPDQLSSDNFGYSIVEGDPSGCFNIDAFSGTIQLRNCKLDYKDKKQFKLKLKVVDEDEKAGFAWLIINIFDANNNAPKFASTVNTLSVYENALVGFSIGKVTATDDDSGENARITYSLQVPDEMFYLNSTTGDITIKKALDREKKLSYQLSIKAQDHGKPYPKSSTTMVIITVLDINDERPEFLQKLYTFKVSEDEDVGYLVGTVKAVDKDDGLNKEIRYSMLGPGTDVFSIAYDSGHIKTNQKLDREKVASYQLIVVATDQGAVQLNGTATVFIILEDVQDSVPYFMQTEYNFTIDENVNAQLGQVKAYLADTKFQDEMTYSILGDNDRMFGIDRRRGLIQVTKPLDYEKKHEYHLKIRVRTNEGFSNTTNMNIYVNDLNDHSPEFKDFYIFLNIINGKFNPVFQIPATDKDVSSQLKYSILSGNTHKFVSLNGNTGKLHLQKSIVNTVTEVKIKFEVRDSDFTVTAFGRISISEVSSEMVNNSIFILLSNITRESFLQADVLKKFKYALAQAFSCDSGRIFILSIEKHIQSSEVVPILEVAIAVREQRSDNFLTAGSLKNLLYLNQKAFINLFGIKMVSFDFGNDIFCGIESCENFENCSMMVDSEDDEIEDNTIKSQYVIFRGLKINQQPTCVCNGTLGYRNGPKQTERCIEKYSLCYQNPCGENGKCFSTDNGYACECESGYSGKNCKIKRCQSEDEQDSDYCTKYTRHFDQDSYLCLDGLKQRWNLTLSFEFSTYDANAVLLYNSRYNDEKDFIRLQIVNGQVELSVSLGSVPGESNKVHTVKSFIPGGVNNGDWFIVKTVYNSKMLKIAVGSDCDVETAHMINPEGKLDYCSASKKIVDKMSSLDLTSPLSIGGLRDIGREYAVSSTQFTGCMRNIKIDHVLLDLANPIESYNVNKKCPMKARKICELKNPCVQGKCLEGFGEAICECPDSRIGQFCQTDISMSSPSVHFANNSKVMLDRVNGNGIWELSLTLKTTALNSIVLEDEINGVKGNLQILDGYLRYSRDSLVLKLPLLYISNGKWHDVKLKWQNNELILSSKYGKITTKQPLSIQVKSIFLTSIGDNTVNGFLGCLKGLKFGPNYVPIASSKNVNLVKGCSDLTSCPASNVCDTNGDCQLIYGLPKCHCKPGFVGPMCIDICSANPCLNKGICLKVNMTLTGFKCQCVNNFTGGYCETKIKSDCDEGYYTSPDSNLCGPCKCETNEDFNSTCVKNGKFAGKCFCKDTFYNSGETCAPCDCLGVGSRSPVCDKQTGQCPCLSNVVGRKCDQCLGPWEEVTNNCNEINTSCPKSYAAGIFWKRVPPGSTGLRPCPHGSIGNATRFCDVRKGWSVPNLFGCTSTAFYNIKFELKHIEKQGTPLPQKDAVSLATQLTATAEKKNFHGADIEIAYNALKMLIEFENNQTGLTLVSSEYHTFVPNIVKSTSLIFDVNVKEFWDMIQEKYAGTAGLMKVMEKLVLILTMNLPYIRRRRSRRSASETEAQTTLTPYSYSAENIYLEIQPFVLDSDKRALYEIPQQLYEWVNIWNSESVEVTIPGQMFNRQSRGARSEIAIGVTIYKTIGQLLPSVFNEEERKKGIKYRTVVYSDVISINVPKLHINDGRQRSTSPAVIVYKNIKVNNSKFSFQSSCAFWNYSLSDTISGGWSRKGCRTFLDNSTDVTCYCDHLTSFALVGIEYTDNMTLYTPTVLTYVAIFVSICLMLVVFFIYLCLRQLKSNANSIHRNLALVGCVSWLIFITLINRPEFGENFCRLIAIIIHYFITCTFSWLFVEALHMYRMILEPRDINYGQMMFYYFIGFGAPLMVVGVTAGLKPEGYGGPEFCWISIKEYNQIMWVYLAPILAIIATDIMIVFAAFSTSCQSQPNRKKKAKIAGIRYRLVISTVFLPLLGATVVSALVVVSYSNDQLFGYLFPGFCFLQGLYLLMFYVIFNRKVRREARNAYIRWKTGDKTYGIKVKRKNRPVLARLKEDSHFKERYRPMLQAFHLPTSSTTDTSDTDGRRRARIKMAGSETTDFPTTNIESSDSSDDDSIVARRPVDSDSDSSENSFGHDSEQPSNGFVGNTPQNVEWKQATQKKLITKRTYASDGPMHSTPSESQSDTSGDRQKWQKVGFTPAKVNSSELSAIQSESEDGMRFATRPTRSNGQAQSSSSHTDSDSGAKDKTPVSILKKKSSYDVNGRSKIRAVKVNKKDSSRKPLMNNDDAELNDSQV